MAHDDKSRGSNGRQNSHAPAVDTLQSGQSGDEDAQPAATTTEATVPPLLDLTPELLGELARAMQTAVDHERERINTLVNQGSAAHVERVRARAASEADELRRLAEEDVDRIKEWSTREIARIREEVSRRTGARRSSLEQYLTHHDAVTAREIESIEGAIREYGETLRRFFAELTRSSDPEEIARRAATLPPMPDLDEVGTAARAAAVAGNGDPASSAVPSPWTESISAPEARPAGQAEAPTQVSPTETALVGVMDPSPVVAQETWGVPPGLEDAAPVAGASASSEAEGATGEPGDATKEIETTAASEPHGAAVRLLRSIAPWTAPTNDHAGDDQPE